MLSMQDVLHSVRHPLVASMHMKKEFGPHKRPEDILVVTTRFPEDEDDYHTFDSYLMDLLSDLEELKNQVEERIGSFDRVDIRTR